LPNRARLLVLFFDDAKNTRRVDPLWRRPSERSRGSLPAKNFSPELAEKAERPNQHAGTSPAPPSTKSRIEPSEMSQSACQHLLLRLLPRQKFPPATAALLPSGRIYSRWLEGANIVSAPPVPLEKLTARRTTFAIDGIGEVAGSADACVLDAATIVSELSRGITLLPGDVIAFGPSSPGLVVPPSHQLPSNTQLTASIEGIGTVTALLTDRRKRAEET
jgi:hypothetical protein